MRILIHSNAPWAPTGYGVQCVLIAKSLRNLGHDVAISVFYGLAGNVIEWEGFTIYPCGLHEFGDDIVDSHAKHWRADCFITLQDIWPLPLDLGHRGIPWVALVPVDSDPLAQSVAAPLRASCFQVVAYSKFGRDKLSEAGIQAEYIPHGVDMTTYYPDPTPKGELKERLGFSSDCFLVGMVAANKGWPSRKSFEECFTAFAQFAEECPDAQFYAHSMAPPVYKGPDLNDLGAAYGISDRLRFANPYFLLAGLDAGEMRKNYSAFDVLLNPSYGEGFGIPIMEAQACFPADTHVYIENPTHIYQRTYTGPLFTIKTKRAMIRATAEHPFWTNRGWQLAKNLTVGTQLLYNGSKEDCCHAQRGKRILAGRIGEVVRTASENATQRSGKDTQPILWLGNLASASASPAQVLGRDRGIEVLVPDGNRTRVSCWVDRRRGHGNDQENEWGQMETGCFNCQLVNCQLVSCQLVSCPNGVARPEDRRAILALDGAVESQGSLPVQDERLDFSPTLEGVVTASGNQARADATRDRVDRGQAETKSGRALYPSPSGDYLADPFAQYEAIDTVSSNWVKGLPVYNVGTESGIYYAEGYLVHNCGVPVIVTDYSSMPELCGGGWLVQPARKHWTPLNNFNMEPSIPGILEALREAYRHCANEQIRADALRLAQQYDQHVIETEYWKPFLERLEDRLMGPAKGGIAAAREQARTA